VERAGKTLWNALRRLADPEKPLDLLRAVWPLIVGVRLATHTAPIAWEEGRLEIAVREPEWQKQLGAMTGELSHKINQWWGQRVVREVALVRGSVSTPREWELAKPRQRPASASKENSKEPLASILKDLEGPLAEISDGELRGLLARFIERYLGSQGK